MASSSGQIMPRCCVLASERMQTTHYVALALAVLAGGAPAQAADVHAYPTVDRVEYVLECMQRNAGRQEFLYKRSEEHTSELQSRLHLVCRLLLEKKKTYHRQHALDVGEG